MTDTGIYDGDILVIDKSLDAVHGKVVVAVLDGDLILKRLVNESGQWFLKAENERYHPIPLTDGSDFHVFGGII